MDIIEFYLGKKTDHQGRYLKEIWNWDDKKLEDVHDYIQWLFPLKERSSFNPYAPPLDELTIKEFQNNAELNRNLKTSFVRILKFYGYVLENNRIVKSKNHIERLREWMNPGNHNFLRITRILTCLNLLGLKDESKQFFDVLESLNSAYSRVIGNSFQFWYNADLQ